MVGAILLSKINVRKEYFFVNTVFVVIASFMVVDCGGGTVDLNKLGEITERTGDFVVNLMSTKNFLNFLVVSLMNQL